MQVNNNFLSAGNENKEITVITFYFAVHNFDMTDFLYLLKDFLAIGWM